MKTLNNFLDITEHGWIKSMFVDTGKYISAINYPYFIDGRRGTRSFYAKDKHPDFVKIFSLNYKTDVGDKKNEINS